MASEQIQFVHICKRGWLKTRISQTYSNIRHSITLNIKIKIPRIHLLSQKAIKILREMCKILETIESGYEQYHALFEASIFCSQIMDIDHFFGFGTAQNNSRFIVKFL